MEVWVNKTLGGLQPADDEAKAAFDKHAVGSMFPIDVPVRLSRSGAWNRRYHVLCTMVANNVERIELEPGSFMEIKNKEDVHVAFKYLTGLYDQIVTRGGIIRLVKSTAFDRMTADQFADYWRKVLDAVHTRILPGIELASVEDELARMAS